MKYYCHLSNVEEQRFTKLSMGNGIFMDAHVLNRSPTKKVERKILDKVQAWCWSSKKNLNQFILSVCYISLKGNLTI